MGCHGSGSHRTQTAGQLLAAVRRERHRQAALRCPTSHATKGRVRLLFPEPHAPTGAVHTQAARLRRRGTATAALVPGPAAAPALRAQDAAARVRGSPGRRGGGASSTAAPCASPSRWPTRLWSSGFTRRWAGTATSCCSTRYGRRHYRNPAARRDGRSPCATRTAARACGGSGPAALLMETH